MPALFVGHGSPMNAIEDNEFSRGWAEVGRTLPRPNAILCISAHWETRGTLITGMEHPPTIHDFGGFPRELFEAQYPAPGSPALAQLTRETVRSTDVCLDDQWGLDHGTWSVLAKMFPDASIPVVQLSLDRTQNPAYHYALGQELRALRNRGVLIIGSGNIVHSFRGFVLADIAYDWAIEFDATIKDLIQEGNHKPIIEYQRLGRSAMLSVPTNEHYLPLLYTLSLQDQQDSVCFFNEKVSMGTMSMRSVWIG
jgi:4,5-DOPA dioxygenase extradiol